MNGNFDRTRRAGARLVAMGLVVTAVGALTAMPAGAQSNPYERGPDPTESLLEDSGPYDVDDDNVSSFADGFGGGTIFYPEDTSDGTFGVVAVSPGFTGPEATIRWLGPRLASHGFVVATISTNTLFDQPYSRARQLEAALEYVVEDSDSDVRERVDEDRLAVMGHSMGGGGSLIAAQDNPDLRAAIPMTPWTVSNNFGDLTVPTLIFGAELDTIAPVGVHASPQYNSIPDSTEKMYLELDGEGHLSPNSTNETIARYSVTWLKRFVDNDTRYDPFLCGEPHHDYVGGWFSPVSEDRDTCPYS